MKAGQKLAKCASKAFQDVCFQSKTWVVTDETVRDTAKIFLNMERFSDLGFIHFVLKTRMAIRILGSGDVGWNRGSAPNRQQQPFFLLRDSFLNTFVFPRKMKNTSAMKRQKPEYISMQYSTIEVSRLTFIQSLSKQKIKNKIKIYIVKP